MATRRRFLRQVAGFSLAAASTNITTTATAQTPAFVPLRTNGMVPTVLGSLPASKLGFTLTHEHIVDGPDYLNKWPKAWGGRAEFVAKAVEKLELLRAAGVRAIVDLTPYDVWRDIRFMEEVSRKSGLNMIACTGQRFFPPISQVPMPARTIDGLTEFFKKEIEQGIDRTGVKAGVIKIGIVGKQTTALEETGLRAAARASKATGAPIRVHTDAAHRAAENQALILENEGINPLAVSFDHSDDSGDMDYFLGLVRRGYSLGMDHVHRGLTPDFKPSFERRVNCIKLLIDAGFVDRIFLSTDSEFGGWLLPEEAKEWRDKLDPPDGMLFITQTLIPHLKRLGVTDEEIRILFVDNPRRFFGGV